MAEIPRRAEREDPPVELRIGSYGELSRAMHLNSWLQRPTLRSVALDLPGLDARRSRSLEKRLRRLFNDCGCQWGAVALVAALVAGLVFVTWAEEITGGLLLRFITLAVAFSFAAKLVSLYASHRRLDRELSHLATYFGEVA